MSNNISSNSRFINKKCCNTKSDLIEITEDKLQNILTRLIDNLKKIHQWLTPLSLFTTLLLSILTTDFTKEFIGIEKDVWSAIFYICLAASFVWLIISVINSIRFYKRTRLNNIINEIKNNE